MKSIKHIGVLKNTGDRVVVVYRQLPDDDNHALVVYPDRLPDRYHDRLMDLVDSDRAQDSDNLYEVLYARTFHDGNNMLQALHSTAQLKRVMVDNIVLRPSSTEKIPLREHNESLSETNPQRANRLDDYGKPKQKTSQDQVRVAAEDVLNNDTVPSEAPAPAAPATPAESAQAMLAQAMLMEHEAKLIMTDAQRKKEEAYRIDPALKQSQEESSDT